MASTSSAFLGVYGSVWPKLQAPKLPQNFYLTLDVPFRLPPTNFISSTNSLTPSSHPFPLMTRNAMPRLPPCLFRRAHAISPHAAVLLPACRDVPSAVTELRWIRSHVASSGRQPSSRALLPSQDEQEARVARLCAKRGRGVPLQYVLGSQPFGALDIKCRPGVLAPRAETEAYAIHLADMITLGQLDGFENRELRVVDFCTGTGCIALALYERLTRWAKKLSVTGVDISPIAVNLSRENLRRNMATCSLIPPSPDKEVTFRKSDVFQEVDMQSLQRCDVLVSNPPYISRKVWTYGQGQMGYSVRKYEPKLALVPGEMVPTYDGCDHADVFYARLLDIGSRLGTRVLLLEVGDEEQALRVVKLVRRNGFTRHALCELWRDWPDLSPEEDEVSSFDVDGEMITVKGSGNVRSVLIRP